jgi:hypothetical protein
LKVFLIKVWTLKFEIEIHIKDLVLEFGFEVLNEEFSFKSFDLINYLINLELYASLWMGWTPPSGH